MLGHLFVTCTSGRSIRRTHYFPTPQKGARTSDPSLTDGDDDDLRSLVYPGGTTLGASSRSHTIQLSESRHPSPSTILTGRPAPALLFLHSLAPINQCCRVQKNRFPTIYTIGLWTSGSSTYLQLVAHQDSHSTSRGGSWEGHSFRFDPRKHTLDIFSRIYRRSRTATSSLDPWITSPLAPRLRTLD